MSISSRIPSWCLPRATWFRFNPRSVLAGSVLATTFLSPCFGATLPGTAPVFAPAGGFGIEGDLRANTPTQSIGDWVTNGAGSGGFVLFSDGTPVNPVSTFHVVDPFNSPVDFVASGGKYYENPVTSWLWKYGNAGDKVDINHAVVHITTATNGHQWAVVSADRLSGNGDSYIDFEFLQDVLTVTPTNASGMGGFTNTAPHGGRRLNDFLVTLAFTGGGSTAEFYVQQWKTNAATGGFDYFTIDIASSLPSNSVFAAVNSAGSTVVPYGAFGGTSYALNTFAEAAVDLTALIGSSFDPCTSLAVKTIVVKTKQSASRSASLGDMITPVQVDLTLGLADAGPSQTKCSEGAATAFELSGVAHPNINSISSMSWSIVSATNGAAITSAASCANCTALPATVYVTNAPATAILRLTVTDTAGCTKSDDVVLAVNPLTTVNGLSNQAVCPSETVSFGATATGIGVTCQWYKGGNALPGQNGANLVLSNVSAADAGTYSVTVSGLCGQAVTQSATLTVNEIVAVSMAPSDQTKCPGESASFTVSATGSGLSYQWFKGGNALNGQTGASLTLNNVSGADAGTYSVTVSGTCGEPVTHSASLTVNENVAVSSPPASLIKCPGQTANFSVTATGTSLTYKWSKGANDLAGQTSSSLALNNVTATDAGTYSVTVSGTCGQPVTHSATLTVNENVAVSGPPTNLAKCPGDTATFSVTATGSGLNYKWFKGGNALNGQTSSSLLLNNVSAADAGTYSVTVSGVCGEPVTHSASLTVNENVAVSSPPASLAKCPGQTASFSVIATGTGLSYQWSKAGNVLGGQTGTSLTLNNVNASDAGSYSVTVSGTCGQPLTHSATLTVNENVAVSSPPANLTKCSGQTASFSVTATGTGLTYQWSKGGSPLAGQTGSSLTLSNVSGADAGSYSVTVSGTCGQPETRSATLTVNENVAVSTPPASLTKCPGETANFSVTATGTGLTYQWSKGGSPLSGQTGSSLVLNNVSAADAGTYSVTVSGTCGGPLTRNTTLTVNQNVAVSAPPLSLTKCPGTSATFSVTATGTGLSYQWFKGVNALAGQTGSSLTLNNVSAAEAGFYSVTVSGACGQPVTHVASLTVNENIAVSVPPVSLTKCPGNSATFTVTATGTSLSYQWFKGANTLVGQTGSSITLNNVSAADAGSYSVTVSGTCGQPVTHSAMLTVNDNIAVSAPPVGLTKCPGDTASFSVIATGTGLSYQWSKGGNPLIGQTSSSLTLNNVTATDAGTYSVTVSGTCGQPVTHSANLTVNENVAVSSPPASLTKCPGQTASFSVTATGTGLSYQWSKGGNPLGGQTSSSLTLNGVGAADAGTYSVTVSGTCGQPVTHSAALTVNADVAVSSPPVNLTKCPGQSASFSVTATGTGLSYQWLKDGSALVGQTGSSLALNNVNASNAGNYSVTVSGTCGAAVTQSATLTVLEPVVIDPMISQAACPGGVISFNAVTHGTGPFAYLWIKDGKVLPGETANVMPINSTTVLDAGSYTVVASGACTSATNHVTLTLHNPTTATPLLGQTNCFGRTATFSTAAGGTGPFTYVWKKDGNVLAGNTASSITIQNLKASDVGVYTVEVTGQCNSVSRSAYLAIESDGLVSPAPFANPGTMMITDFSPANPYPSSIEVFCVPKPLTSVTVTISNLSHTYGTDLDILLLSPSGQAIMLMSDAGSSQAINNATLVFSDAAANPVSDTTPIVSGIFKPTNYGASDNIPLPAPLGPYASSLSDLNGTDANGTWSLFVIDDAKVDTGIIAGGWSMVLGWEVLPPTLSAPAMQQDGSFRALLHGQSGNTYVIEGSSDFLNWVPVSTNTLIQTTAEIIDLETASFGQRFYRAVHQP